MIRFLNVPVGLLDRLTPRRPEHAPADPPPSRVEEPVFSTKALRKFLGTMSGRESPTLMDLAPVVGSNLNFFGDHLGCKVLVEDIHAEVERHAREIATHRNERETLIQAARLKLWRIGRSRCDVTNPEEVLYLLRCSRGHISSEAAARFRTQNAGGDYVPLDLVKQFGGEADGMGHE